ncbi:HAD-IA family hydrolase [Euzebya tangerina]|uniref:HAD-IA family hydrolase n=1 Tax=Euzebya tangerina TaxID=591198 RepID=UPI000E322F20|nr:HAD-IA family hydrolase [Euzebya tangerina]
MADPGCACAVDAGAGAPARRPEHWETGRLKGVRDRARARRRGTPATPPVLLLDMGGVVIPTLFESVAVPGFPGGPFEAEEAYATVERGERQEREYWADLTVRRPDLDLGELWRTCSRVRPQLAGVLPRLASVARVVAFTNDMAHWFGDEWPTAFPELAWFDRVLEAAKMGELKPAVSSFRRAAEAIGVTPKECLFVDDLQSNLDGARRAGMQTLLFDVTDPAGSIAEVCRQVGTSPPQPTGAHRPSASRVFAVPRALL